MIKSSFFTLPNELLLVNLSLTVPYSIEHISLACKSLYRLSENARREHQQLKQKFRYLDVSSPVRILDEVFGYLPGLDHLHGIVLSPRLSWYRFSVSLWTGVDGYQFDTEDLERCAKNLARISQIIQNLISSKFNGAYSAC